MIDEARKTGNFNRREYNSRLFDGVKPTVEMFIERMEKRIEYDRESLKEDQKEAREARKELKKLRKPDDKDCMSVVIVDSIHGLLEYPDDTPVMVQWKGNWRSDFFKFDVYDVKSYLDMKGGGK